MSAKYFTILAFSAAFSVAALSGASSLALAQGYSGLIAAPSDDTSSARPAPSQDQGGYRGLIAPKPDDSATRRSGQQPKKPQGYRGLVPGEAPQAYKPSIPDRPQVAQPEQQTPVPRQTARQQQPQQKPAQPRIMQDPKLGLSVNPHGKLARLVRPENAEGLKALAFIQNTLKNQDNKMLENYKLSDHVRRNLEKPLPKIDGMSMHEASVKRNIETLTAPLKDGGLSADERKEHIKNVRNRLITLKDGYLNKQAIPPEFLQRMGMPETYINEQAADTKAAINRLDAALKDLKRY